MLRKLQAHSPQWLLRRIFREFIRPTTVLGRFFYPLTRRIYPMLSRPMHHIATRHVSASAETLYYFYDFEVEPITYDFVWSLCVADARRKALGLKALHIVFVPGSVNGLRKEQANYEQVVSYEARLWRIHAILLPSIQLIPCPCSVTMCTTREAAALMQKRDAKWLYPTHYQVTFPLPAEHELAVAYGASCLSLQASTQAKAYIAEWLKSHPSSLRGAQRRSNPVKKLIVITLRDYAFTPERNSNLEAWARFAHSLDKQEFFVVFVPDTEKDLQGIPEPLKDFCIFHQAAWNVNLRAALYETAYLNLGVNTGPMALCWFNAHCRYITFKIAVENVPHFPVKMTLDKGFVLGQNPRFAQAFQKWVWEEDDLEIITREFHMMCHAITQSELVEG